MGLLKCDILRQRIPHFEKLQLFQDSRIHMYSVTVFSHLGIGPR